MQQPNLPSEEDFIPINLDPTPDVTMTITIMDGLEAGITVKIAGSHNNISKTQLKNTSRSLGQGV